MATSRNPNRLFGKAARLRKLGQAAPEFKFGWRLGRVGRNEKFINLPFKRSKIFILISGAFFAAFCIPYFTTSSFMSGMSGDSLFDLVFGLFSLFWFLGWSVGVAILGLVFLCTLAGRETLYIRPGKLLLRIEVLGLGVGVNYHAAVIKNLRREAPDAGKGNQWRGEHLAFDYVGEEISFGSDIDGSQAEKIVAAINRIAIDQASDLDLEAKGMPLQEDVIQDGSDNLVAHNQPLEPAGVHSLSTRALIVANLIPLLGVLFDDWSIGDIMLLFWAESAVIGLYNLMKMWVVGRWAILMIGPFFVGHFGGFMVGHLLFIYALFQVGMENLDPTVSQVIDDFINLWPALLGLLISHGISYRQNFLGRQEYVGRTINQQMGEPYKRIIVMHVTIIFGGFLVMAFSMPLLALLLLIVLKIIVDVRAHLGEHNRRSKNSSQ